MTNYYEIRQGKELSEEVVTAQKQDEECTDSLFFVNESPMHLKQEKCEKDVFHFSDKQITSGPSCFRYSICVNAVELDSYMRKNKSSRSAVFATFMNMGIAEINDIENNVIVTSVAADVRKILGVENTLRESTGTIPLCYDQDIHKLTMEQRLGYAREMIISGMIPEKHLAAAAEAKKNNLQLEKRISSLEGKKRFANRIHPYAYKEYTYAMSNIGKISFGQEIDQQVSAVNVITCANTYPIVMEIIQFQDTYNICYCTRIENDPYVQKFVDNLKNVGISCNYQQEKDYTESLVIL